MAKNTQVMTPSRPQSRRRGSGPDLQNWWRETRSELRKVTWPTAEQTRNLTLVVVAVCLVMAAFLGIVDFLLSLVIKLVLGL